MHCRPEALQQIDAMGARASLSGPAFAPEAETLPAARIYDAPTCETATATSRPQTGRVLPGARTAARLVGTRAGSEWDKVREGEN